MDVLIVSAVIAAFAIIAVAVGVAVAVVSRSLFDVRRLFFLSFQETVAEALFTLQGGTASATFKTTWSQS